MDQYAYAATVSCLSRSHVLPQQSHKVLNVLKIEHSVVTMLEVGLGNR